nr:NF045616 family extracytoplasmic (lipo)protein [Acinetobacter soli]
MPTLIACNEQSKELNTEIKDTNLCIYTNESKNDNKVSFLVELAKINFNQDYEGVHEKSFDNVDLPIAEKNCVLVSLINFEKNQPYVITLGTINHTYRARICVIEINNQKIIKSVEDGKDSC